LRFSFEVSVQLLMMDWPFLLEKLPFQLGFGEAGSISM
jgi:hypothetical protein